MCLCGCGLHPEAIGCEVVIAQQSMSNDWLADAAAVCAFLERRASEDEVQPAIASRMQQVQNDLALQQASVDAIAVFLDIHPTAFVGMCLGGNMML